MKKLMALFFAVVMMSGNILAADDDQITDEELWKYALMNEVIEQMKKDISATVNEMIKNQEGIDGKRYLELAKTNGDEAKLSEIEATDFEKKFLELVENEKNDRIEAIKVVNQELATKMVGDKGRTYKAIKEALNSDAELKTKFEEFQKKIQFEGSGEAE